MMDSARLHITRGLVHCGLLERYIQQEVRSAQEFPVGWAAYLYPVSGSLQRDGSRARIEGGQTTRILYQGRGQMQLELFAPDQAELLRLLGGLLTWLFDHPHIDTGNSGLHMRAPEDGITFSFQIDDGESVLQMRNGVRVNIPVEIALSRDNAWVPVSVELHEEVVGGNPDE
ncbi:MAG: hypothetical protein SFU83_23710 [Meiothermus sp.]|nr:hypothetical protein [Meiothermus sp.]